MMYGAVVFVHSQENDPRQRQHHSASGLGRDFVVAWLTVQQPTVIGLELPFPTILRRHSRRYLSSYLRSSTQYFNSRRPTKQNQNRYNERN